MQAQVLSLQVLALPVLLDHLRLGTPPTSERAPLLASNQDLLCQTFTSWGRGENNTAPASASLTPGHAPALLAFAAIATLSADIPNFSGQLATSCLSMTSCLGMTNGVGMTSCLGMTNYPVMTSCLGMTSCLVMTNCCRMTNYPVMAKCPDMTNCPVMTSCSVMTIDSLVSTDALVLVLKPATGEVP